MTHTLIYPHSTRHNEAGHLEIGGCDVVELADRFGTPLFIYDEQTLREQCRAYVEAFPLASTRPRSSTRARPSAAAPCVELVVEEGLSVDVASGGELYTARLAGVPPERIYFHGNNKSPAEIEAALDYGIGTFVVDSLHEIELLSAAARRRGVRAARAGAPHAGRAARHAQLRADRPGRQQVRLRLGRRPGRRGRAGHARGTDDLELIGVHAHIGSQIFDLSSHRREVEILFGRGRRLAPPLRLRLPPVQLRRRPRHPLHRAGQAVVDRRVRRRRGRRGHRRRPQRYELPLPRLLVEPGRSIAGKAAVTAYRIGTIKEIPGVRTYVAIDGGMSDNMRPMLYDSQLRGHAGQQGRGAGDARS